MAKKRSGKRSKRRVRVGTSGWSYPDWQGVLYSESAKRGEFLSHYVEHFDAAEVDGSHSALTAGPASLRLRHTPLKGASVAAAAMVV